MPCALAPYSGISAAPGRATDALPAVDTLQATPPTVSATRPFACAWAVSQAEEAEGHKADEGAEGHETDEGAQGAHGNQGNQGAQENQGAEGAEGAEQKEYWYGLPRASCALRLLTALINLDAATSHEVPTTSLYPHPTLLVQVDH